jgi:hypothetical protein
LSGSDPSYKPTSLAALAEPSDPSLDRAHRTIATRAGPLKEPLLKEPKPPEGAGLHRPRRGRHFAWKEAHGSISRERINWWKDKEMEDEVVGWFRFYIKDVENKVLVLHNGKDDEDEGEAVVLPYRTRADPDYIREVRRKLRPLKRIRSDRAVMMTLTTDPSRFVSLKEGYHGLMNSFHRLMTFLNKRYGCELQYVAVPEFTKSGIPHLHVVILGVVWVISQAELSEVWSRYGQGEVVDIRRCGQGFRNSSVFRYVMKYVEKSWDIMGDEPKNLLHVAYLWALNARSFSVSRGLLGCRERVRVGFMYLGAFVNHALELGHMIISWSRLMHLLYDS